MVATVSLQPSNLARLVPPGVTGLHLPAMFDAAGWSFHGPERETRQQMLRRFVRALRKPPGRFMFAWEFLHGIGCIRLAGGNLDTVNDAHLARATGLPVVRDGAGIFAAEEGGLAMLEELDCERGMVVDLGQTLLKVSWAGRRWAFPRDIFSLANYAGPGAHTIAEKGAQRRVLRRFIAESLRKTIAEAGAGSPEGVVFGLPSALDKWGQPAGSSYIGMSMDTQLVPDSLELAGLPDTRIWLVNDAELAATSAIFDERVIQCGGKALVFTLGTAVGCALADPVAAALHFLESGTGQHSAARS